MVRVLSFAILLYLKDYPSDVGALKIEVRPCLTGRKPTGLDWQSNRA